MPPLSFSLRRRRRERVGDSWTGQQENRKWDQLKATNKSWRTHKSTKCISDTEKSSLGNNTQFRWEKKKKKNWVKWNKNARQCTKQIKSNRQINHQFTYSFKRNFVLFFFFFGEWFLLINRRDIQESRRIRNALISRFGCSSRQHYGHKIFTLNLFFFLGIKKKELLVETDGFGWQNVHK